MEYNGWTNYETWNTNLWNEQIFQDLVEGREFNDVDEIAECFAEVIWELVVEQQNNAGTFIGDAIQHYLQKVNFREIAECYAADYDLFETVDEETHDLDCNE